MFRSPTASSDLFAQVSRWEPPTRRALTPDSGHPLLQQHHRRRHHLHHHHNHHNHHSQHHNHNQLFISGGALSYSSVTNYDDPNPPNGSTTATSFANPTATSKSIDIDHAFLNHNSHNAPPSHRRTASNVNNNIETGSIVQQQQQQQQATTGIRPLKQTRQLSRNFSEFDFMDSGLGRSLTSKLPVLDLEEELMNTLQHDDMFAEEYLLSKLQDAQRRLQEVRDLKASLGGVAASTNGAVAPATTTSQRQLLDHRLKQQGASAASQNSYPTSPLCNPSINSSSNNSSSYSSATTASASNAPVANGLNANGVSSSSSSNLRLFVASYRLPLTVELADDGHIKSSAGSAALGLAASFKTLSSRFPIRWLGAPGQVLHDTKKLDPDERAEIDRHLKSARHRKPPGMLSYKPLFPDPVDAEAHQEFCNSVLWPLFHYISFNLGERSYHAEVFRAYVRINRFYAQELVDEWKRSGIDEADAIFWIHDFQLCLVPKMIRDMVPNARIGFFLHVPFPTREVFRILAPRTDLLEGMLGADLLGFHTYEYARHFLTTCERVLGLRTRPDVVDNRGIDVHVTICPFGIDAQTFIAATQQKSVVDMSRQLKESLAGKKIVVGIDRLDYIKGIPHKLLAIEHFFEHHPEWIGRVVFLQVTTPSTSRSDEYHAFRSEILEMVGRINGRFATIEDTPIHYREFNMTLEELCGLYSGADVAMITSLRDGMNLVSYEYIACQKESHGVLLLSEFAGAAKNLPGAVLINPWDVEGVSDAIVQSLEMSDIEREIRHHKLYRHVIKYTSAAWGVSFIEELIRFSAKRGERRKQLIEMPVQDIVNSFHAAAKKGKRVFFLDYDGTLRKYETQPELAFPSASLLRMLQKLASNENNIVFIITGRCKATMSTWFRGVGVGFAVEHGFSIRWPDHLRERFGGRRLMDGSLSGGTGTENGVEGLADEEKDDVDDDDLDDDDDYDDDDDDNSIENEGNDDVDDADSRRRRRRLLRRRRHLRHLRLIQDDQHTWDDLLKPDELIAMRNALHVAGEVLRNMEECTPSSFVTRKESAFSWHFRDSDPTFAQMRAQEAKQSLEERLAGGPMEVLMGSMILYVRPRGVHKGGAVGEVLTRLYKGGELPAWIFSVGDDCTDEDMFTELSRFAKDFDTEMNTCTVGRKVTSAKYYVSGVDDVVRFLSELVSSDD